ncbi:TPA: helix-turn-helix transcriptional regulator [Clostridioides difficile]|nr:helix-turn-helix transcriptional regulator [Clostridioides difficile]HBF2964312.1 helix-turn-helix transcriptional regulator [Clostridioides difficile]HBG7929256.1 helix-turn-helix transcriptional regulator [Clostridioides difficile]HDF4106726.1 helix-turn-helix transcriptional regulator [Clostridioides difficile]HDQ2346872.1 helix-turn-helix transcriptional regulator [Clostridioides difficile]
MSRKLKAVRVEIGLTQKQLAELINMPLSTYRKKNKSKLNLQ